MTRRDEIDAEIENGLRKTGVARIPTGGMLHHNRLRKRMENKLDRPVTLRGSVLLCEPDQKKRRSSTELGGEDGQDA